MARDGSGIYSAPAGTKGTPLTTIDSADYNAFVDDLVSALNDVNPQTVDALVAGTGFTDDITVSGTATLAEMILTNSTGVSGTDWNDIDTGGFFWGTNMTNNPTGTAAHYFFVMSQCYDIGALSQIAIGIGAVNLKMYRRSKVAGTWGSWAEIIDTTNADELLAGQQTIWVPASAMVPRVTNGATRGVTETTDNKVNVQTLDFSKASFNYAQFTIAFPKSWDLTGLKFRYFWMHDITTVNFGVVWGIQAVAVSDGNLVDSAFDTPRTVEDIGGAATRQYATDWTSPDLPARSPAEGDLCYFSVYRAKALPEDTLAVDAKLIGLQILYNTTTTRDD